jgi:tetrapyrrole methylase family protein / MazG family protein
VVKRKSKRYLTEVDVSNSNSADEQFADLLRAMAELRGEKGCPWDKEQTHASLKSSLLEETYELLDAIDAGNDDKLREELGDVLHQIVFHCQIANERGAFTVHDVVGELKDKMVRRHPHVFSGKTLSNTDAVLKQWARLKAEEKQEKSRPSALGNLPRAMPALARAQTLTERASHVGFDWPDGASVWQKVEEELAELKQACFSANKKGIGDEMGDLLFSLVNLARFFDLQAEEVLSRAIDRFIHRFAYIETKLREAGKTPMTSTLEEMDSLWNEAKEIERNEK